MRERIKELEKASKPLEPTPEERASIRTKVVDYGEDFLNQIYTNPAFIENEEMGKGIYQYPFGEDSKEIDELLHIFKKQVDDPALNAASGGHLGYIPGGGLYSSALGDYLADVTNKYAGVHFAGPGAVRMENMIIRWCGKLIGYTEGFAGNLTSGGSIANLIGIVTARDGSRLSAKDFSRAVIYGSARMHHCLNKAVRIAGLGEATLRNIPLDDQYKMKTDLLRQQIEEDRNNGLHPLMIIGSAGTTDLGSIDPLDELARICKEERIWFHVDAAYGGFFMLVDEMRRKFKGIEQADSVVLDPHKGLFLPYGTGLVLVKNGNQLQESFHYQANYLQDTFVADEELSPAELSPELTKHFRGLRTWLPLQLHGLKPFRACIEEKYRLTQYFYEQIKRTPDFEVGPEPELSVATFRYNPGEGDLNALNKALLEAVRKDGRIFLSSTTINGKFIIRMACLSFRSHLQTIDLLMEVLKEKTIELKAQSTVH